MSVSGSEMNLSWSTLSGKQSVRSQDSSVFLTTDRKAGSNLNKSIARPQCVSAKISGMRFQSWREPKPLRSRCGSAVHVTNDEEGDKRDKVHSAPRKRAKTPRKQTHASEDNSGVNDVVNRLSQSTLSSRHKSSVTRAREANVDMNWYSWSKMNVYKDYQAVIYKDNGTLRPKSLGQAR